MWPWVVLYCLYASIGACSLSVGVLEPLLFVPHVLPQVVALHWRFEIVSIGWIRDRITCFNLTVSILVHKREFPNNKIALVNVIGHQLIIIWKSCVFENGRHISAPFGVVELFFELSCLFYKHLAQKDVYVARTLTLLFACRLLFLLASYLIHRCQILSTDIVCRMLYRVYHEPSVKTVHQIQCCSMIITFSKPTHLKQFIHKGGFLWKVSVCLPAACEPSPEFVKQQTLQLKHPVVPNTNNVHCDFRNYLSLNAKRTHIKVSCV